MGAVDSKVFRSGNSEAVRLPKEVAYGEEIDVVVSRMGDVITIRPKRKQSIAEMIRKMQEIGAPEDGVQAREPFEDPERPGL